MTTASAYWTKNAYFCDPLLFIIVLPTLFYCNIVMHFNTHYNTQIAKFLSSNVVNCTSLSISKVWSKYFECFPSSATIFYRWRLNWLMNLLIVFWLFFFSVYTIRFVSSNAQYYWYVHDTFSDFFYNRPD